MERKQQAMDARTTAQGGLEVQPSTLKMKTNGPTEFTLGWGSNCHPTSMQQTESASGGRTEAPSQQENSANPISSMIDGITSDPIGSAAKALKFLI